MSSVSMRRIALMLVALACVQADTKKEDARFSPGPISSYQNKQTIQGVTVAAAPYDTEELAHAAFGKIDPNRYGILPVLVIIQNDTDKTVSLTRMEAKYERADDR